MISEDSFEVMTTDLGGRIGNLKTKSSVIETPALLPVIHPVRQLVPCREIRAMGYEAVMTNAYTTYRQLKERSAEGIHKLIEFDGTVMTDSGGYQVLEYGSVNIQPEEMAQFEESIGSDIATILDKPTGLFVSRQYATHTVDETIRAAKRTAKAMARDDIIWSLPIQGGKYLDLVARSAKLSAELNYGCYALGSPVEVMEDYDFTLLVRMILQAKKHLPINRPFHLFGAGHSLIIPLAVALGCDMFDSASYMLYAKQDRYISLHGTVRVEDLRYLGCSCEVCRRLDAKELRSLPKEQRIVALAKHNLALLKSVVEQTKQAISEGRLWEYVQSTVRNHPKALDAFRVAVSMGERDPRIFEYGTPLFKDKGLFVNEKMDLSRPELKRFRERLKSLDLSARTHLIILPETKTKPFLKSKIFEEVSKILATKLASFLITFPCPNFGLVPAELSDIYPLSQATNSFVEYPTGDSILLHHNWFRILALLAPNNSIEEGWLCTELANYRPRAKRQKKERLRRILVVRSYRKFKDNLRNLASQV